MSDDSIRCPEAGDIPAITAAFADGRGGAGGHHKRDLEEQRQGIGSRLLDGAARRIADRAPVAGIGVGLTSD